jgi:hypothetical protein
MKPRMAPAAMQAMAAIMASRCGLYRYATELRTFRDKNGGCEDRDGSQVNDPGLGDRTGHSSDDAIPLVAMSFLCLGHLDLAFG